MHIRSRTASGIFKLALGMLALAGVLIEMGALEGRLSFYILRFFTILSNTLAAGYFLWAGAWTLLHKEGQRPKWAHYLKGIVTMNLTVTMLIAHFMLGGFPGSTGLAGAALWTVHYIVPLLAILDWVLFDEKGGVKGREPVVWLAFPCLYLAYVFVDVALGPVLGTNDGYPYPFLDAEELGLGSVALTVLLLTAGFLLLGYVFWIIDRAAGRGFQKKNPPVLEEKIEGQA